MNRVDPNGEVDDDCGMSETPTQANRQMAIITPLGTDVLLLRNLTVTESLGNPFVIHADLQSLDADIDFAAVIGKNVTIRLKLPTNDIRYFNGIVSTFRQVGFSGNLTDYRATIVPWLWMLTRTSDCRIFQNKTVPQILKQVFGKVPSSKVVEHLTKDYPSVPYCVQYNETSFNFVSRLMEREGIFYYFQHTESDNIIVLCDGASPQPDYPGYETIHYNPDSSARYRETCIYEWVITHQVDVERFSTSDYDYTQPKAQLFERASSPRASDSALLDTFRFPGFYRTDEEGGGLARVRMEARQVQEEIQHGQSNALGLAAGHKFRFSGYRRRDQNVDMRTTALEMRLTSASFQAGAPSDDELKCECEFTAVQSDRIFRSSQRAIKPAVPGPQPATVVASKDAGDVEFDPDSYGSVLVKFHWDHDPEDDSEASCRVRVQQHSADATGSSMFIPQVGSEVMVSFQYGNPDRPIITGRVFNADIAPPIDPAEHPSVSYIQNAANENVLKLDATSGAEKVLLQNFRNQIAMDSTDGLESLAITDGASKIVLDPVSGSITVHTPGNMEATHHGQVKNWTWGDYFVWVLGSYMTTVFGATINAYGGNNTEITAGTRIETTLAGKLELTAALSFVLSKGWKVEKGGLTDLHTAPEIVQLADALISTANVSRTAVINGTDDLTVTGARTETVGDFTGTYASINSSCAGASTETVVGVKTIDAATELNLLGAMSGIAVSDLGITLSSPSIYIGGELVNIG